MNEITMSPVIVNVVGATAKERKMSVIRDASGAVIASNAAMMALIGASGDVGKAARSESAGLGLISIAKACCNANYRPLAEYLAVMLGEPVVLRDRAAFEGLPGLFEQRALNERSKKNGGYRIDAKTGTEIPTVKHALYLQLEKECRSIVTGVRQYFEDKAADKAAKDAEYAAIAAPVTDVAAK